MSKKLTKREYQLAFIALTKSLTGDVISLDEYGSALEILINNYRKDYK